MRESVATVANRPGKRLDRRRLRAGRIASGTGRLNNGAIESFFDSWSIYERVLEQNYMFHEEIYRGVARFLAERFGAGPFSILDLGCGSAQHLAQALQGRKVSRYVGYDLSQTALDRARSNLEAVEGAAEFRKGDFFEGVRAGEEKFSLILSSYSLHHLQHPEKERFFHFARKRLAASGMLLLIDIAREAHEDRPEFLDNYCGWIQREWKVFPEPALKLIFDHIRGNDFPEPDAALRAMAAKAGFKQGRTLDKFLWHRSWVFDI